ncbi:hypothetical protein EV426DRAFT_706013 [Tirmania nivea]|nr:hypothetical protein EV426DRAFT_706013 [Tirmania nivea]
MTKSQPVKSLNGHFSKVKAAVRASTDLQRRREIEELERKEQAAREMEWNAIQQALCDQVVLPVQGVELFRGIRMTWGKSTVAWRKGVKRNTSAKDSHGNEDEAPRRCEHVFIRIHGVPSAGDSMSAAFLPTSPTGTIYADISPLTQRRESANPDQANALAPQTPSLMIKMANPEKDSNRPSPAAEAAGRRRELREQMNTPLGAGENANFDAAIRKRKHKTRAALKAVNDLGLLWGPTQRWFLLFVTSSKKTVLYNISIVQTANVASSYGSNLAGNITVINSHVKRMKGAPRAAGWARS